ncbi:hypothetical protein T492DRAFT_968875, partial [Pavlovales sp. CCMP2436]
MGRHPADVRVQLAACAAIGAMGFDPRGTGTLGRALSDAGLLPLLARTLSFPTAYACRLHACCAAAHALGSDTAARGSQPPPRARGLRGQELIKKELLRLGVPPSCVERGKFAAPDAASGDDAEPSVASPEEMTGGWWLQRSARRAGSMFGAWR